MIEARSKFGWTPYICIHNGDPGVISNAHWVDYSFSFAPTDNKNCHSILIRKPEGFFPPSVINKKHPLSAHAKRNFCNFIYRNATGKGAKVRQDFCKLLMQYKKVDCPGIALNNMPRIKKYGEEGGIQAKLDCIASYKFTIAFENISDDCYISEKIFHPLMVGSIPIYWGCRKIEEYINPDCFINCHNYESFTKVIDKIKEIDSDPDLYQQYVDAKPVLPDSRFYEIEKALAQRVEHIATKARARRELGQKSRWVNLWKTLLFIWENKNLLIPTMKYVLSKKVSKWLKLQ